MQIKATHLCCCGHKAWNHTSGVFKSENSTADVEEVIHNSLKIMQPHGCSKCISATKTCKKFQLPNLDYVEYLAEKRGLV